MHNLSSVKAVFDHHTTPHDPTKHRKSVMKTESIAKSRTSSFPRATNANSAHSRGYSQTSDRKRGYEHVSAGKQENKQRSSVTDLGNFKRRKVEHSSKTQHSRQPLVSATSKAFSAVKGAVNMSRPLEPMRRKAGPFNMEDSDEDNDDDVVITDHRVLDHGPVAPKTVPPPVPQQDVTNTQEAQRAQSRRLREESLFKKLGGLRAEEKQLEPEVEIVSVFSETDPSSKTPTTDCERLERAGPSPTQAPKNRASQLDTSRNTASPSHLVSSIPSKANLKPESIDLTGTNSVTTTAKHHFKLASSGKVSGRSRREGVEDIKGSLLQDAHSNGRVSSQNVARSNDHELEKNPASHAVTVLEQRDDVEVDRNQSPKTLEEANGGDKEPLWHEQLQSNLRKMQQEKELQAKQREAQLAHAESQKRRQQREEHERRRTEAESLRRKQRDAKQKQEQEDREAEERRAKQEQMRLAVLQQHEEDRREREKRDAQISKRNAEQAAVQAAQNQAVEEAKADQRRRRQISEAENSQRERDEGLLEVVDTNEAANDRPTERTGPPNKPLSQITRDVFGVQGAQDVSLEARSSLGAAQSNGPRSLNSTSGQAALRLGNSSRASPASPSATQNCAVDLAKARPHGRALGDIKQEDALLVRLKHHGDDWPAIIKAYERITGVARAKDTLRSRYNKVSQAFQEAGMEDDLVRRLAEGEAGVERQVNTVVRQKLPPPASIKTSSENQYDPALGEIRRDDAMLVRLRDSGNDWSAIIKSLEKATGKGKTESTLRRRYNKVSQALQAASVSDDVVKRFADGNQEAGKQINIRVRENPPPIADAPRVDTSPDLRYQEDANIYVWREKDGCLFPEIADWYEGMTGKVATAEALRKRYQKMRDAVQAQKLSMADVQKIANDYPEKLQEPKEPSKAASSASTGSPNHPGQSNAANIQPDNLNSASAQGDRTLPAQHPPAAHPSAQFATPPSSFSEDQQADSLEDTTRPTTGGKTMNTQTAFYLLESQRQTWQAMDEEKQAQKIQSTQQPESDHDDDEYYFIYRLYRRDTDIAHPENDEENDDWIECDQTYTDLLEANDAARKEVVRALPGHHLYDSVEHTYSCRVREDDMQIHTLELSGMRRVEVAVDRVMKRDAERMLPRRRWDGISAIGYVVRERVSANEEASQPSIERCVGNSTYTALELANDAAVKYWVEKTFTSESTKLHVRDTERMEMQGNLLEGLEDGEMFEREGENGEGRMVKVWVEVSRLVGPRNV